MICSEKVKSISGIYLIKNLVNEKIYVGSSVNLFNRYKEHFRLLKKGTHHNYYLQQSWNKYGDGSFYFDVLEVVTDKNRLIEREQYWMDLYNVEENGYNMNPTAGSQLGRKNPEDDREKFMYCQPKNRPIVQIDMNGEFIKEWFSHGEIAKTLGVGLRVVRSRLAGNKGNMIFNSFFIYKDEYTLEKLKECISNKDKTTRRNRNGCKVLQFDLLGNLIKEWDSMIQISNELNISTYNITQCCKGNKISIGGFKWKYAD